jgi:hypothetical protein
VTLRGAAQYIMALPEAAHGLPHWVTAIEWLMLVGDQGGDPMMPRIAMMHALHRNHGDSLPIRRIRCPRRQRAWCCGSTHLDRLSDRVSLPCAAGLRPGFCERTGRPRRRSNLASNASEPTGRPVPSAGRSAAKASGSVPVGEAADADEQGGDTHQFVVSAFRCARTLDHGQSCACATMRARAALLPFDLPATLRHWCYAAVTSTVEAASKMVTFEGARSLGITKVCS